MTVRLDPELFRAQLGALREITDAFGVSQTDLESVFENSWTSLVELNKFDGPHGQVVVDLADAFNAMRILFEDLAADLELTFRNFVETDECSAKDIQNIETELADLKSSLTEVTDIDVTGIYSAGRGHIL